MEIKLSKKSLELLKVLFAETSNLQLPVGVADTIIEIKKWVEEELKEKNPLDKSN